MPTENTAVSYKGSEFIRAASGTTKDIFTVLLEPDKMYTEPEVSSMLDKYLKKKVEK